MAIEDGKFVQVEYTGTLEDGSLFDSTEKSGQPLEFQLGASQVIEGFEAAIKGMDLDEEKEIKIEPAKAYGDPDPELIKEFPRENIPNNENLEEGQRVIVTAANGMPFQAKIVGLDEQNVKIDLNHPLAGETLNFKIKVVGVTDEPTQGCSSGCASCSSHCG